MLIHEFENNHHRLIDENKQGEWVSYEEIARLDNYAAVTHHYPNLPSVFTIEEVTNYKNQYLDLDSDLYWNKTRQLS